MILRRNILLGTLHYFKRPCFSFFVEFLSVSNFVFKKFISLLSLFWITIYFGRLIGRLFEKHNEWLRSIAFGSVTYNYIWHLHSQTRSPDSSQLIRPPNQRLSPHFFYNFMTYHSGDVAYSRNQRWPEGSEKRRGDKGVPQQSSYAKVNSTALRFEPAITEALTWQSRCYLLGYSGGQLVSEQSENFPHQASFVLTSILLFFRQVKQLVLVVSFSMCF